MDTGLAFAFVTLLWFTSTGAILWLNRLDVTTHPASLLGISILCGPAVCALITTLHDSSAAAAYIAFTGALMVWAWHEMSFLMGFVAGPRRVDATPGLTGWARFTEATATVIHHEVALAFTTVALVALCWGQPNTIAAETFALLFALRLSAKLNIFLGVANLSAELMPDHLAYVKSYFRKRAMNWLFPLSFAGIGALTWWLGQRAPDDTGSALLFALAALGLLEHALLMLPLKDSALWQWATPRTQIFAETRPAAPAAQQGLTR